MYRGQSPIFDAPEFPPLRRVKPLPKRRRTSGDQLFVSDDAATQIVPGVVSKETTPPANVSSYGVSPQPYYAPAAINGGQDTNVTDIFRIDNNDDRPSEYPGGFAIPVGPVDEDDNGDGDYVDHLQQPGNTKKRKVPAAAHSTVDPLSSPVALGDEDEDGRGRLSGNTFSRGDDKETSDMASALPPSAPPLVAGGRQRYSPATLAGLQHKELLKTRKKQLAAVLGALSHGDTLALEQALSARYSNLASFIGHNGKENIPYDRIRKKPVRRKPASWAHLPAAVKSSMTPPSSEFTFLFPSPTSERLISTREEVAILHSRFEAELTRQAAKAAEMAKRSALAAQNGATSKRERAQQRARTSAGTGTGPNTGNATDTTAAKVRNSKKKKRSALANASNPHHLRNYVPSRLPHSGVPASHAGQGATALNLVSALPVRFLTAEIPPQRRKKVVSPPHLAVPLLQPEDEWICPLCEYNLFYGGETAFRRAIRNRKKILIRRRRARERAAAAASGQKPGVVPMDKTTSETFESALEEEYGLTESEVGVTGGRGGGAGTRKERDKAGGA